MLDWWFDVDNRICGVRMDERKTAAAAVFDGGIRAKFEGVRLLKSGMTYVYTVAETHSVNINDVKLRGERYVSLYFDGRLIKEYNVRAEYIKHKYGSYPQVYDNVSVFFCKMLFADTAFSLFTACFAVAVMTAVGVIKTLAAAGIFAAALAAMLFVFFGGAATFKYGRLHCLMERYSVISSVKKRRKPRRHARRKR